MDCEHDINLEFDCPYCQEKEVKVSKSALNDVAMCTDGGTTEIAKTPKGFTLTQEKLADIMLAHIERGRCLTEAEVIVICEGGGNA